MVSSELLAQMKQIQLRTKSLVTEQFAGEYESAFKGQGMAFEDVRPYYPGDDVRFIDWNVTARCNQPFIKLFREERELTVILLVDVSASMQFGSGEVFKHNTAATLAALLANVAMKSNDKVGMILFSNDIDAYIPPKKGPQHVWRLIRELISFTPEEKQTNIANALDYLNQVIRKRAVVFLISDFFCSDYNHAFKLAAKRHDLVTIALNDPMERKIAPIGLLSLNDMENGESILIDTNDMDVHRMIEQSFDELQQSLKKLCHSTGADYMTVTPQDDLINVIMGLFRQREHMIK